MGGHDDEDDDVKMPREDEGKSTEEVAGKGATETSTTKDALLDKARRFLQEDDIRDAPRERKVVFLKSKGIEDAEIERLLAEEAPACATITRDTSKTSDTTTPLPSTANEEISDSTQALKPKSPPIITYPEFLPSPERPKPLVTASTLLNAASLLASLSTLVYGSTRYVAEPMLDSLTDARVDFHQNANTNITKLVEKLEGVVSVIPEALTTTSAVPTAPVASPEASQTTNSTTTPNKTHQDSLSPSHRDMSTQTTPSLPTTPTLENSTFSLHPQSPSSTSSAPPTATSSQSATITRLTSSARALNEDLTSQAEDLHDVASIVDLWGDELRKMAYQSSSTKGGEMWNGWAGGSGGGSGYGSRSGGKEADDGIKEVRDSIRKMKGVLLGARSFPTAR